MRSHASIFAGALLLLALAAAVVLLAPPVRDRPTRATSTASSPPQSDASLPELTVVDDSSTPRREPLAAAEIRVAPSAAAPIHGTIIGIEPDGTERHDLGGSASIVFFDADGRTSKSEIRFEHGQLALGPSWPMLETIGIEDLVLDSSLATVTN